MPEDKNYEEEDGYKKVDRRVIKDEDAAAPEEPPAEAIPEPEEPTTPEEPPYEPIPEPEEPAPAEEPAQDEPMNWAEVGVYGVLRFTVGLLVQLAWINLGIQAPPGGETRENLPEAQAAISSLGDIITRLEPDLSPDEKRELDAMLANLRINYIQRAD